MGENSGREIDILRQFEPVLRFTRGERFFPFDIERYIAQSSLWVLRPDGQSELVISDGELTIEKLVGLTYNDSKIYFLKFIDPPDVFDYTVYRLREAFRSITRGEENVFRAGRGRLARVGFGSRFVDALFSISLLLRGRVPGDTAAAAVMAYEHMQKMDERYSYYGRVLRENDWVVLQYWFFYPYNNWRSGFFGVNDHEADWEMVCIYCYKDDAVGVIDTGDRDLHPRWVAYASHDFHGDDLRRRWDDPEVDKVITAEGGQHPVVYVGAGSHASYYSHGEYLAEIELPFLAPFVRLVDSLQGYWHRRLRLGRSSSEKAHFNLFRIPFVDYARGDGRAIGPAQEHGWQPVLVNEDTPWAVKYRGLWGLYAKDPIAGENAPAGPVYNRKGDVRLRWYDPVGWAGLDKVPPPNQAMRVLSERCSEIEKDIDTLTENIDQKKKRLVGLGLEEVSVAGHVHLEEVHSRHKHQITALSNELKALRHQRTVEISKLEALSQLESRIEQGEFEPMRGHIRHDHAPSAASDLFLAGFAEYFSALSVGLIIVGIVLFLIFARQYLLVGLVAMIGFLIIVEAGFRRQLPNLINGVTIVLAILSMGVIVYEYLWEIVVLGILSAGLFVIVDNLREIIRR